MRAIIILCFTMVFSGCSLATVVKSNPVSTAQDFLGLRERQNRQELKELTGVDPVRTEWCAAFVNAILEIENIPNLHDLGSPSPLLARQFLNYGEQVRKENIQTGDIVIFPRGNEGWKGHVGFFVEEQDGMWVILGGNQSNEVRYDLYSPHRAIGVRRYTKGENS